MGGLLEVCNIVLMIQIELLPIEIFAYLQSGEVFFQAP